MMPEIVFQHFIGLPKWAWRQHQGRRLCTDLGRRGCGAHAIVAPSGCRQTYVEPLRGIGGSEKGAVDFFEGLVDVM